MSAVIKPKREYGVDAPWVPWMWVGFAARYVVFAIVVPTLWNGSWQVGIVLGVAALGFAFGAGLYWHATFRGKFVLWNTVLNMMSFTGTERVLELGCGRGAVAIKAALRVPAGHVTGIDIWRTVDQSGNSATAARRNAESGMADVVVRTVDGNEDSARQQILMCRSRLRYFSRSPSDSAQETRRIAPCCLEG